MTSNFYQERAFMQLSFIIFYVAALLGIIIKKRWSGILVMILAALEIIVQILGIFSISIYFILSSFILFSLGLGVYMQLAREYSKHKIKKTGLKNTFFFLINPILILLIATGIIIFILSFVIKPASVSTSSSNSSTNSKTWQFYTSPEGNFKILFPSGNPKITTDKYYSISSNPDLKYRLLQYDEFDTNGDEYWVEVGVYPKAFNARSDYGSLNVLKGSIEENLKNFDNAALVNSKQSLFMGAPSIDLQLKSKDLNYKYRIFILGDYSYKIASSSTDDKFSLFDKFANSFSVINDKNNNLTWKPLISEKWNFKITFPNDNFTTEVNGPTSESLEGITYTSMPSTRTTYVITIQKYKSESNLRELLNYTLKYVKSNSSINFKLISSKDSTCSNKPCLIFLAQQNDQEGVSYYKGEAIAADNNIVYYIFGTVDNERHLSNIDKIINSFEFLK